MLPYLPLVIATPFPITFYYKWKVHEEE